MAEFSHLRQSGEATMVDVGGKEATVREAITRGEVRLSSAEAASELTAAAAAEIARTARLAGIQAAKQTAFLIPFCHQVPLTGVDIEITYDEDLGAFSLTARTRTRAATGVEMEGMTALSIAGTCIYDMIKAVDPAATVGPFRLEKKTGGRDGTWSAPETENETR